MKMVYIIIKKTAIDIVEVPKSCNGLIFIPHKLEDLLEKCFGSNEVTENIMCVEYDGKQYDVSYKGNQRTPIDESCEEITYNLSLALNINDTSVCAKILEQINLKINEVLKPKYYIILSFDGISEYYCNELFPFLNRFERLLRDFVFKILTRMYGHQWFEKTQTELLFEKLKEMKIRNDSKLIKNIEQLTKYDFDNLISEQLINDALYEMTLNDIQQFLFAERSDVDLVNFLNKSLSYEKLMQLSKDDIIKTIENNRPQSLWNEYFAEVTNVEGSKLKSKLKKISRLRNNVAHSKNVFSKEYSSLKRALNEFIPLLERAIIIATDTPIEIHNYMLHNYMINKLVPSMMAYVGKDDEQLLDFQLQLEKLIIDPRHIETVSKSFDALINRIKSVNTSEENLQDSKEEMFDCQE